MTMIFFIHGENERQISRTRSTIVEHLPASVMAGSEDQAVAVLQGIGASLREHAPQMRQSALHDVQRGRRIEVEETLGYILTKAAAVG
jgi:ketopantoate reductase